MEQGKQMMGRVGAVGLLMAMASRRDATEDDVTALRMAVRCLAKRHFDAEAWHKRRNARKEAGHADARAALGEAAKND